MKFKDLKKAINEISTEFDDATVIVDTDNNNNNSIHLYPVTDLILVTSKNSGLSRDLVILGVKDIKK